MPLSEPRIGLRVSMWFTSNQWEVMGNLPQGFKEKTYLLYNRESSIEKRTFLPFSLFALGTRTWGLFPAPVLTPHLSGRWQPAPWGHKEKGKQMNLLEPVARAYLHYWTNPRIATSNLLSHEEMRQTSLFKLRMNKYCITCCAKHSHHWFTG